MLCSYSQWIFTVHFPHTLEFRTMVVKVQAKPRTDPTQDLNKNTFVQVLYIIYNSTHIQYHRKQLTRKKSHRDDVALEIRTHWHQAQ